MSFTLLQTKLHIPPMPPQLVHRPRLIERLNEQATSRLTLFSAPAGFGKTTLLSEWISQSKQPIAWLSLDEGDNDPARFLAYLIAALQSVQSNVGQAAHAMLQSPQPPPPDAIVGALINDLDALSQPFALVLDDYHVIEAQPIHHALAFLLENLPSTMHVIIASRADPPIPLARLRAQGQLTEIRINDLRFTTDEAGSFLRQATRLNLSVEDIAALEARTEGWVAGLQMAALSMRGQKDIAGFIRAFGGSHRYILDYLVEQVLDQQPAHIQDFLLQTCILDQLTAPLCDAVAGSREFAAGSSQAVLEYLESSNLFIVPLDDERRWYRYHRLFADLLRYRLQQSSDATAVAELHHRAANWLEQNGLPADAVSHLLAAGDVAHAARLIEQTAPMLFWAHGQVTTVLGWMRGLPEEQIRERPRLCLTLAWAEITTLQFDAVEGRLRDAEKAIGGADRREAQAILGEVAALRVMLANFRGDPRIIEMCREALEHLPEDALFLRGTILGSLGGALSSRGEATAACDAFAEASRVGQRAGNTFIALSALGFLGDMQALTGQLHRAAETYQQALDMASEQGALLASFTGMANVGMGKVLYEWNDLENAERHLMSGIELGEEQGDNLAGPGWLMLATGYLAFARLWQARGDADRALKVIQKAETLARKHDPPQLARIAAARARVELTSGNLNAAVRWIHESGLNADDEANYAREFEHLTLIRILIAQGRGNDAVRLLERLRQSAESAGRTETVIETLVLQALALSSQSPRDESTAMLERALALAEPEGYVRMFVDEGAAMAELLGRIKDEGGRMKDYARTLLTNFGEKQEPHPLSVGRQPLAEPLSDREMQVLHLIAEGYSNQEIAEKLVITVTTVKKHVSNIFGKMGVTSRTQAIARARELRLT